MGVRGKEGEVGGGGEGRGAGWKGWRGKTNKKIRTVENYCLQEEKARAARERSGKKQRGGQGGVNEPSSTLFILHSAVGNCTEQRTVSVCSPSQTCMACPHEKYSAHIVDFFFFFFSPSEKSQINQEPGFPPPPPPFFFSFFPFLLLLIHRGQKSLIWTVRRWEHKPNHSCCQQRDKACQIGRSACTFCHPQHDLSSQGSICPLFFKYLFYL